MSRCPVQFWAINTEKQRTLATQRRLPYQVNAHAPRHTTWRQGSNRLRWLPPKNTCLCPVNPVTHLPRTCLQMCLLCAAQDLPVAPDGFKVDAATAGANSLAISSALSTPSVQQLQAARTKARLMGDSAIDVRWCSEGKAMLHEIEAPMPCFGGTVCFASGASLPAKLSVDSLSAPPHPPVASMLPTCPDSPMIMAVPLPAGVRPV